MGELHHIDAGDALSHDEYHSGDTHQLRNQHDGDLIVARNGVLDSLGLPLNPKSGRFLISRENYPDWHTSQDRILQDLRLGDGVFLRFGNAGSISMGVGTDGVFSSNFEADALQLRNQVPIDRGGTGAGTVSGAKANLGIGTVSSANLHVDAGTPTPETGHDGDIFFQTASRESFHFLPQDLTLRDRIIASLNGQSFTNDYFFKRLSDSRFAFDPDEPFYTFEFGRISSGLLHYRQIPQYNPAGFSNGNVPFRDDNTKVAFNEIIRGLLIPGITLSSSVVIARDLENRLLVGTFGVVNNIFVRLRGYRLPIEYPVGSALHSAPSPPARGTDGAVFLLSADIPGASTGLYKLDEDDPNQVVEVEDAKRGDFYIWENDRWRYTHTLQGEAGVGSTRVYLYRNQQSRPTSIGVANLKYDVESKRVTTGLAGWSLDPQYPPAGSSTWFTWFDVRDDATTDTVIPVNPTAYRMGGLWEKGDPGDRGNDGVDGFSSFERTLFLSQANAPAPPDPTSVDKGSRPVAPAGWSVNPPTGSGPIWATIQRVDPADQTSVTYTGVVRWDGVDGADGADGTIDLVFRQSTSEAAAKTDSTGDTSRLYYVVED